MSIVIKPVDKGSGVVVWDREDYLLEAESQLGKADVYEKCEINPLPTLQTLISKTLKTVKGKREIDDKISNYLMVNDPRFCLLYTSPSPRDKRQSRMPSSA